jgi:hypothetical protein
MSNESTVVGVRVSPDRRDELERYVEQTEYDSVPSLFRHAVAHEMDDDYGLLIGVDTGAKSESNLDDDRIGEIMDTLGTQNMTLQAILDHVSSIRDEMEEELPEDRKEAMDGVYEALPDGVDNARPTHEIADQADLSETSARRALADLQAERMAIQTAEDCWFSPR